MNLGAAIFFTDYSITPVDLAMAMEERGLESLWLAEHSHIPLPRVSPWPGGGELPKKYYDTMDPFICLAQAGAVTKTLKLGTGICLVVQRDPIQTAKEVASLDQLSDGRVLFGIGAGWNAEEMADHGTEFRTRFKLMRERIALMKSLWADTKAEYHGDFIDFGPAMAWPKPKQAPHPPIIVGGGWPHAAKRAIAWGDGWIPLGGRDLDVARLAHDFFAMAKERDRNPATLDLTVYGVTAEADRLASYRDAGVKRAVVALPSAGRDEVLPLLDQAAENLAKVA